MSERPARPTRADFGYWEQHTTRWADIDVYGHMNNARYFELIDTVVNNQLIKGTGTDIARLDAIGVVAEVSCRYFREIGYPDPVDCGVTVDHLGRSSVVYRVGLFREGEDEASAEGRFVHVYVDNTDPTRPTTPVPDLIRDVLTPLLRTSDG